MKSSIVWTGGDGISDVSKGIESWNNVLFLDSSWIGMEGVLGEIGWRGGMGQIKKFQESLLTIDSH